MTRQFDLSGDFQFTRRWFLNRNYPTFREYVYPEWAGKPATYLELGCFEGMSMCWMLQHILTHPDSRAVGVDPWLQTEKLSGKDMEDVMQRAMHNTERWRDRCQMLRANSAEVLRRMVFKGGYAGIAKDTVDLSMVDGNHNALAVLDDCRLVYRLLKPGGWMLLDDVENDRPKKDHVKEGLQMWLAEVGTGAEMVFKHRYMECYRKVIQCPAV